MKKIVIGILAHVDAGKTTLSESILYLTGTIRKMGRVDNQDAFLDTDIQEKERGITIFSKQAEFTLDEQSYVLLDTPGHVDFSAEMERTLQVLDYAILVISGADGIQGHTQTLWQLLKQYHIPVFIFINKMDQPGTDAISLMDELQQKLSDTCICFGHNKEQLFEEIAMCNEEAMNDYLESGIIETSMICHMINDRIIFPCFFGSALKLSGISEFLNQFRKYTLCKKYPEDFAARVFKISRDSQGKRLTYMKITGGSLKVRDTICGTEANSHTTWSEKISQIRIYNGLRFEAVETASAGTVCAVTGLTRTTAGEGLGIEAGQTTPLLEPVLTYSLDLPDGADPHKLLQDLQILEEEEPALHIHWEEELQEIQIQLMGEIQTEVLKKIIAERFGLDIHFGNGRIVYKETIASPVVGVGHFEPLRHYAEVHLLLEPSEPGSGLSFSSECSENVLAKNWQRLILTHLEEKIHKGVLTGSQITDMHITLTAGRAHQKHTEGGDFRQATYRAVRQGLMHADNILLEPFYEFRLEIPQKMVGRAMTDMERLYAKFELTDGNNEQAVLTGIAPVSTMGAYQKEVSAYTSGKGILNCHVKGYFPCHNSDEVIATKNYDPDRDISNPTGSVFCAHGAGFVVPWNEVEQYMHIGDDGIWCEHDDRQEDQCSVNLRERGPSLADDKELEAIFVRTYGEIKPRIINQNQDRIIHGINEIPAYIHKKTANKNHKPHYLLVDGYNIIFAWQELNALAEQNMDAARNHLMEILSNYQGYTGCNVILVFDAYRVEGFPGELMKWQNIDVVFTKEAETADQYIEKTAHAIGHQYHVTVATSDGIEQIIIRSKGCLLLSARDLKVEIDRMNKEIREQHLKINSSDKNYLFDYLSETDSDKIEAIRRGDSSDD